MRRIFALFLLAAVVLSAITASAALLIVDGGTLQVFSEPVDIEIPPPDPPDEPRLRVDRPGTIASSSGRRRRAPMRTASTTTARSSTTTSACARR